MQQMPTFHLITGRDALDRHAIDKGSSGLLDGDYLAKRHVLVCEGDWTLAETLRLDWTPDWCSRTWLTRLGIDEAVDADGIAGMLVLGDLVIDGALINADIDSGPFLVVQGNLTARAVASGGASIIVHGSAHVAECVIGTYNHGGLSIGQRLRTTLFIRDDHFMGAAEIDATVRYDPREDGTEEDEYDDSGQDDDREEGDEPFEEGTWLPAGMRALVCDDVRGYDDIWRLVCEDRPVVAPLHVRSLPAHPRHQVPTNVQECLERARVDEWFSFRQVPEALRQDEALLLELTRACPRFYDGLEGGRHLRPAYMLANLDSGSSRCLAYLKAMDSDDLARDRRQVLTRAVDKKFEHLDLLPGHFVDAELFEHARGRYESHPEWEAMLRSHGQDHWRITFRDRYHYDEMLRDESSKSRTADALTHVWECFWTEPFLLRYIVDWWGIDAEWIPARWYTPPVYAAVAAEAPDRIPAEVRR